MGGSEWWVLYLGLGALAGFMGGLLGLGGGGILVPLLASAFARQGMPPEQALHTALGTALTCMIVSSTASLRAHAAQANVDWRIAAGMAPGIVLGALLVTQFAQRLDAAAISLFFSLFMLLVAARLYVDWQPARSHSPPRLPGLLGAGAGIGAVSALAAVGGGFLTVAYLNYKRVEMKRAVGTSAAIGLPIALAGTAGYMLAGWAESRGAPYALGYIHLPATAAIAAGSTLAAPLGARCSRRLPDVYLKRIFAGISLALSLHMLNSFLRG